MVLSVLLICLVLVAGFGNAFKPPFPDAIEKEKSAGTNVGVTGTETKDAEDTDDQPARLQTPRTMGSSASNTNDGTETDSSVPAPVTAPVGSSRNFIPGSKRRQGTPQTPQSPASSSNNEGDTLLASSPKSKGRKQPEGSDGSANTENSGASSSVDNTRRIPPSLNPSAGTVPAAPSAASAPAPQTSAGGSVTKPYSCDSLPAGANQVPFSCYDQGKLKDYCTQNFGTVSQTVLVNSGSQVSGLKRYVVDTTLKANWFQALGQCQSRNMSLATVESYDEQKALSTVLNSAKGVQNAWLSATDLGQLNHYVWMSTGQPVSWTNWYDTEPNHETVGNETEHCIEVINYRWKWNDNLCSNQEFFVCQYYSNN